MSTLYDKLQENVARITRPVSTVEALVSGHPTGGRKKCPQLELAAYGNV